MKSGKEINGNRKVKQRMQKGKSRIGKVFAGKIKGEILRRSARSAGKYRKSKEKVSFGAEKSDVPSKNHRKLDSKWENGKGNRR